MIDEIKRALAAYSQSGSSIKVWLGELQENEVEGDNELLLPVIDGYAVVREYGDSFWLMFRVAGYDDDYRNVHTIRVDSVSIDGDNLVLHTDTGYTHTIIPLSPEYAAAWATWQAHKRDNAADFEHIDAYLLDMHTNRAKEWLS